MEIKCGKGREGGLGHKLEERRGQRERSGGSHREQTVVVGELV